MSDDTPRASDGGASDRTDRLAARAARLGAGHAAAVGPSDGDLGDVGALPSDGDLGDVDTLPSDGDLGDVGALPSDGDLGDVGTLPSDGGLGGIGALPSDGALRDIDPVPSDGAVGDNDALTSGGAVGDSGTLPSDGALRDVDTTASGPGRAVAATARGGALGGVEARAIDGAAGRAVGAATPARPSAKASSGRAVCIVLHDVAASTQAACERTLRAVAEIAGDAPVTLLAVPRYHGERPTPTFEAWLHARVLRGDELALHGLTHRDDGEPRNAIDRVRRRHYTRSEGEFADLDKASALARIDTGRAWFARHRWPLAGFVAPAWLLGEGGWAALAERDFAYTATLRHLFALPSKASVTSQSVVYSTSSGWRRRTSLAWNAAVARWERGNPLLRLELHPRDADFAAVRASWQRILAQALADRTPMTVRDFMAADGARRALATSDAGLPGADLRAG